MQCHDVSTQKPMKKIRLGNAVGGGGSVALGQRLYKLKQT